MYKNYPVPPTAPMDALSIDRTPDADAGKSRMYKIQPGMPYSTIKSGNYPSIGVNDGTTSNAAKRDPNFPMR